MADREIKIKIQSDRDTTLSESNERTLAKIGTRIAKIEREGIHPVSTSFTLVTQIWPH